MKANSVQLELPYQASAADLLALTTELAALAAVAVPRPATVFLGAALLSTVHGGAR
ncbi:hypothetical protein [Deinococcus sp. RM]|uniref:hypothetical protein n=1 Tax=Deinococcus sp. RM TaxID=2316359 RepID=UPI0013143B8C|nr:hypothetical protein [Deinococcus sp. RM]